MDQIAYTIKKDPLEVRLANIDPKKEPEIIEYINDVKNWAEIDNRKKEIERFNKVRFVLRVSMNLHRSYFRITDGAKGGCH